MEPDNVAQFSEKLEICQSFSEIKRGMQELNITCHSHSSFGSSILQRLLVLSGDFAEVREFMLDRASNLPGSKCLLELLDWFICQQRPSLMWNGLYSLLSTSIELGLCLPADIQLLLDQIPNFRLDKDETKSMGETPSAQKWYNMIAKAARSSPVFGLKDLTQSQLQQLITLVRDAPFSPIALETFRFAQSHLHGHETFKIGIACDLIRLCVTNTKPTKSMDGMDDVKLLLQDLQPAAAVQVLIRMTDEFVSGEKLTSAQFGVIELWAQGLSSLARSSARKILSQTNWADFGWSSESVDNLSSKYSTTVFRRKAIMRLWAISQLGSAVSSKRASPDFQALVGSMVRVLKDELQPHQDLMAEVVFTLQLLSLPSPSLVLRNVAKSSASGLSFRTSVEKYQAALIKVADNPLSCFRDDEIYQVVNATSTQHMKALAHRTNCDPESFLHIAQSMIMQDAASSKIVTRILRSNLDIKMALAYARRLDPKSSSSHTVQSTPGSGDESSFTIAPTTALHIINTLATSFAISPALSPREAYRKVYWLYCFLCRYTGGSAVGESMTRALWHAGVTRYQETGATPERVQWVLSKVRQVEGNEAAQRLLRGTEDTGRKGGIGNRRQKAR